MSKLSCTNYLLFSFSLHLNIILKELNDKTTLKKFDLIIENIFFYYLQAVKCYIILFKKKGLK